MIDLHDLRVKAINQLKPNIGFAYNDKEGIFAWHSDTEEKPTDEEIDAKVTELRVAEPMRLLRQERNRKLAETDWMSFSDSPTMTDAWRTYRQALRDLPSTAEPQLDENGQLTNVTWPTKPE